VKGSGRSCACLAARSLVPWCHARADVFLATMALQKHCTVGNCQPTLPPNQSCQASLLVFLESHNVGQIAFSPNCVQIQFVAFIGACTCFFIARQESCNCDTRQLKITTLGTYAEVDGWLVLLLKQRCTHVLSGSPKLVPWQRFACVTLSLCAPVCCGPGWERFVASIKLHFHMEGSLKDNRQLNCTSIC
jgi:hypothetical protein